jgi:hypothetical protein
MNTLADIILIPSFLALIAGLIRPRLFHKFTHGTHQRKKIGFVFGLAILIALIMLLASAPTDAQLKQQQAAKATTPTEQTETAIKAAVSKDLSGTNNVGGKKLRTIDVVPQEHGGFGVFVEYNADEVGSHDSQMTILTEDMTKLYKTIYSETHQDVRTTSVSAYFAGTDQYGNKVDKLVYKTILTADVANKVNWGAENATLETKLPALWDVTQNTLGN